MGKIALCNVNYVEIESAMIYRNMTIEINGDIITDIYDSDDKSPEGFDVFEGTGLWIIPGLVDMHIHSTFLHEWDKPDYYMNPCKIQKVAYDNLTTLRNCGVTVCRDMGSYFHSAEWIKNCYSNDLSLPLMLTCGEVLTYKQGHMHELGIEVEEIPSIHGIIKREKEIGADFIKIASDPKDVEANNRFPNPAFDLEYMQNIVDAADREDLKVACHTYPSQEGLHRAVASGIHTIEHAACFCRSDVGSNKRNSIYYVPTIATAIDVCGLKKIEDQVVNKECYNILKQIMERKQVETTQDIPDSIKEWLDILLEQVPYAVKNNFCICTGSDAGCKGTDFETILREILILCSLGATYQQGLMYAITYPCRALGLLNRGRIEKNYIADMVLLKENPLENIATLMDNVAVMCRGTLNYNKTRRNKNECSRN